MPETPAGPNPSTGDPDAMAERLDELGEATDRVRRQAREHGTLGPDDGEPTYFEPDPDGTGQPPRGSDTA